jgi:hypothetical protein
MGQGGALQSSAAKPRSPHTVSGVLKALEMMGSQSPAGGHPIGSALLVLGLRAAVFLAVGTAIRYDGNSNMSWRMDFVDDILSRPHGFYMGIVFHASSASIASSV